MEQFLSNLYSNSNTPVWSAILLGLLTAISPCPLATNITAISYLGKNIENQNKVFYSGIVYTLGRALSYTILAFVLFIGADKLKISLAFQRYGEKLLGPLLIIIGLFMLGIIRINLPGLANLAARYQSKGKHSYWDALLIGILFALAFCPYSGVLYFGMLIPMTIQNAAGLALPVFFAIATGVPVIIFAWLLAYTVSGVGKFYNRVKTFELRFRRIVALIFVGVGIYYIIIIWR